MELIFFTSPEAFRTWLAEQEAKPSGEKAQEVWVGFYKKATGKPTLTWPESVDAALCYGWIDGVRKSVDEISYKIRFTPRKAKSIWSNVNIKRVEELTQLGLMQPAGLKAFNERQADNSGIYSHEQGDNIQLPEAYEQEFRQNEKAWNFFQKQSATYRKAATWWVVSAKREETRRSRLTTLITDSQNERTIAPLTRKKPQAEK